MENNLKHTGLTLYQSKDKLYDKRDKVFHAGTTIEQAEHYADDNDYGNNAIYSIIQLPDITKLNVYKTTDAIANLVEKEINGKFMVESIKEHVSFALRMPDGSIKIDKTALTGGEKRQFNLLKNHWQGYDLIEYENESEGRGKSYVVLTKDYKIKPYMKKGGNITTDGTKGGLFLGKTHKEGGIQAVVTDAGNKPIEVETLEPLIYEKSANCSVCVHTLNGKTVTNKEALSELNQHYGGVPIAKDGAEIGKDGTLISNIDGKPIDVNTGQVVIKAAAYKSDDLHEFDGKKRKVSEILSIINQEMGGNPIPVMEAGGGVSVSNEIKDAEYWEDVYNKNINIENRVEFGYKEGTDRTFGKASFVSPKYIAIAEYCVAVLKQKGWIDADYSGAASGTMYVRKYGAGSGDTIRISDHIGRGGVFSVKYDISTLSEAKTVLSKIPDKKEVDEANRLERIETDKRNELTVGFFNELKSKGLGYKRMSRTYKPADQFLKDNPLRQKIKTTNLDKGAFNHEYIMPFDAYSNYPSYEYALWYYGKSDKKNAGGNVDTIAEKIVVTIDTDSDTQTTKGLRAWTFGDLWNGFATPFFEKPEADIIAKDLNGMYFENTKKYVFDIQDDVEEYPMKTIDTPEGKKEVYPIGAYGWVWWDKAWDEMGKGGGLNSNIKREIASIKTAVEKIVDPKKLRAAELCAKYGKGCKKTMDTGGGIDLIKETDIAKGAKFKIKTGTIFIIDRVYSDKDFGTAVETSIEGGKKGNYKDSKQEVVSFLNEEKAEKIMGGGGEVNLDFDKKELRLHIFNEKDENVGYIQFKAESETEYVIIDSIIKEKERGNGYYQNAILKFLKDNPDIAIYSVYRSGSANYAWDALIKNLPEGYEFNKKHYPEERTTEYELKYVPVPQKEQGGTTTSNLRDLTPEEMGGLVVMGLKQGETIRVESKDYLITKSHALHNSKGNQYLITRIKELKSGNTGTIYHREHENIGWSKNRKDGLIGGFFRGIESDILSDLLQENNPFHDKYTESYTRAKAKLQEIYDEGGGVEMGSDYKTEHAQANELEQAAMKVTEEAKIKAVEANLAKAFNEGGIMHIEYAYKTATGYIFNVTSKSEYPVTIATPKMERYGITVDRTGQKGKRLITIPNELFKKLTANYEDGSVITE